MEPTTIVCDSCGGAAVVQAAHHTYSTRMYGARGGLEPVLVETRYEIECPKCGERIQVVEADPE